MTAAPVSPAATVAPDGSPVELFALLPPGPGPGLVHGAVRPGAEILELGCGAGRLTRVLTALGHPVVAVDQSPDMLAHAHGAGGVGAPPWRGGRGWGPGRESEHGATAVLGDIEGLDLGRRFEVVLLASFLVNVPDPATRAAFLSACARHLGPGGVVVIQRLDPELVPVAVDVESEEDGVRVSMSDVVHDGDRFAATMRFGVAGRTFEQRYEGLVLDDAALDTALAAAGLRRLRFLDAQRTWVTAERVAR